MKIVEEGKYETVGIIQGAATINSITKEKEAVKNLHRKSLFLDIEEEQLQTNGNNFDQLTLCHICLKESELNHSLISVCKCTGARKYVHLDCLKKRLQRKDAVRVSKD